MTSNDDGNRGGDPREHGGDRGGGGDRHDPDGADHSEVIVERAAGGRLVRVAGNEDAWLWCASDSVVGPHR